MSPKTVSPQTMEKLCQYHTELWNWLAETGSEFKFKWPGWECPEVRELCGMFPKIKRYVCFACYKKTNCGNCFIAWGASHSSISTIQRCYHRDSPYLAWLEAKTISARKQYAITIADAFRSKYAAAQPKPKPKRPRITKVQRIVNYLNQEELAKFCLGNTGLVEQVVEFAAHPGRHCAESPLGEDMRQLLATTPKTQLRRHCAQACKIYNGAKK